MANASVLSSGMGLGFPAITLEALKDQSNNDKMHLNDEQASWFGKKTCEKVNLMKSIRFN